jgi:hypothetical protein
MDEVNGQETSSTQPLPVPVAGSHRTRFGRRTRLAAGIGTAAVVAGLCALGVGLASSSAGTRPVVAVGADGPAGSAVAAAGTPGSAWSASGGANRASWAAPPAHRSAGLRTCLETARHLRATGHWFAARARLRACLRMSARFGMTLRALVKHAMHGQITFSTSVGIRTLAFEHGTVRSVSGSSIVVRAADGTMRTWMLTSSTIVTGAGRHLSPRAVAAGQQVVVVGQVTGRADDATRVFVIG